MKKGLVVLLGTALLAVAGSGFAEAPMIGGVPDVNIGDAEDNVGATADLNFFRYVNAFNVMSFVSDADSTAAQLKFAFDEKDTDINNIAINGVKQLANPAALPSAWGASAIPAGEYWFSVRDILRSPLPADDGNPDPVPPAVANAFPTPKRADGSDVTQNQTEVLPWSTTALNTLGGTSREVVILVGDEADQVASDTILVTSNNNASDSLSSTFTTVYSDSTFAAANWVYVTAAGVGVATSSGGTGGGYLGLATGATAPTTSSSAYYARWYQQGSGTGNLVAPIPYVAGNVIYAAKMTLELNAQANGRISQAPDLRIGVENPLQQLVTANLLYSQTFGDATAGADAYNPHLPAVGASNTYNVVWSANSQLPEYDTLNNWQNVTGLDLRTFRVFFDALDFNAAPATNPEDSGTWRLTNLVVGTVDRPATMAPNPGTSFSIVDFTAANGWASEGGSTTPAVTVTAAANQVQFAAAAGSGAYALWRKLGVIAWEAGKIVRVTAKLSVPTQTSRDNFAQARIRHQTLGPWVAQVFSVRRSTDAGTVEPLMPAVGTQTPYELYVPSYGGPNAAIITLGGAFGQDFSKWVVALDHVPNAASDGATTWICHELIYELLADPIQ